MLLGLLTLGLLDRVSADESEAWLRGAYSADVWNSVDGGLGRGSRYLHRIDLFGGLELPAIAGAERARFFGHLIHTNASTFSDELVGDAQTVSNIDAPAGFRMLELWYEARYRAGASVKLGLFDLNSEFDLLGTGAFFINSSHGIGPELAQSGENGPSIFPVTSLAVRADVAATERTLLRFAVLDAVPGAPDDPDRTSLHVSSEEGALAIGEIEVGLGNATRAYTGVWGYSQEFPSLDPDRPLARDRAWGLYGAIEGAVSEGVTAFARAGWAAPEVHAIESYLGSGLLWQRGLPPWLSLGLACAWAFSGDEHRAAMAAAGERPARYELGLEFSARFVVTDWLALQPDIQWIRHPGARHDLDDALVVGLRLEAGTLLAPRAK